MDGARFDQLGRQLGRQLGPRLARRAIGAPVLGAALTLLGVGREQAMLDFTPPTAAAACLRAATRCRRHSGGSGDNCRRCCTGYAKRRPGGGGRCACKPAGKACRSQRECCAKFACENGTCTRRCGEGGPCRVFASNTGSNGNFGGLAGADAICQQRATAAELPGTYMAWLSSTTASPSTRFTRNPGPYVLVTGTMVAASWDDLTDGTLLTPISLNETGAEVVAIAATATSVAGTLRTDLGVGTCDDWTSNSGLLSAFGGIATEATSNWTAAPLTGVNCGNSPLTMYCFQQS